MDYKAVLDKLIEELNKNEKYYLYLHYFRYLDVLKNFVFLKLDLSSRILDVGCGRGYLAIVLKQLGYELYAIDLINLNEYNDRWRKYSIRVVRGDIENAFLPFTDERFDLVIFSEVIEHLDPRKVKFVLKEINRVLKRRGLLLLTTPNLASFSKLYTSFSR